MRRISILLVLVLAACKIDLTDLKFDPIIIPELPGAYVSVSTDRLVLSPGRTEAVALTIKRTGGYLDAVSLSVDGLPSGVTAMFTPAVVAAGSTTSTLTISVDSSAQPGQSAVTIHRRVTVAGAAGETIAITLVVGGKFALLTLCQQGRVAYLNDAGRWESSAAAADGRGFQIAVSPRGTMAVAVVYGYSGLTMDVAYGTADQVTKIFSCAPANSTSKFADGIVANLDHGDYATIALGSSSTLVKGPLSRFFLISVPNGALDLVGVRSVESTAGHTPVKLIIRRGVDYPSGSTIPALDFDAPEAVQSFPADLRISGIGSDECKLSLAYRTASAIAGSIIGGNTCEAEQVLLGVPAALQVSSDLHVLQIDASPNEAAYPLRGVQAAFRTLVDRSLSIGPPLSPVTATTLSAAAPVRMRLAMASQAEYGSMVIARFAQNEAVAADRRVVTIRIAAEYFADRPPGWDLSIPDLSSAISGSYWGLQPGMPISWQVTAYGGRTLTDIIGAPTEGTFRYAARSDASRSAP